VDADGVFEHRPQKGSEVESLPDECVTVHLRDGLDRGNRCDPGAAKLEDRANGHDRRALRYGDRIDRPRDVRKRRSTSRSGNWGTMPPP
jgi:hypothetical protein